MILVVTGGRGKSFIPKLLGMMKGAHWVGNQPPKKPPQKWVFFAFFWGVGWNQSALFRLVMYLWLVDPWRRTMKMIVEAWSSYVWLLKVMFFLFTMVKSAFKPPYLGNMCCFFSNHLEANLRLYQVHAGYQHCFSGHNFVDVQIVFFL